MLAIDPTYRMDERSEKMLIGIHPDLVGPMRLAHMRVSAQHPGLSFVIYCGIRTTAQQRELVASGASTTMKSRHLSGHAVDLAPTWRGNLLFDWPLYHKLAPIIKQSFEDCRIPVEWGGDWKTFTEGPHWQLPWAQYPR